MRVRRAGSIPSRRSAKPWTKWRRVCSPSVTTSIPACSWSRSARSTASRCPSTSVSGGSRHGAHSVSGAASHAGLGRLPAMVVASTFVYLRPPGEDATHLRLGGAHGGLGTLIATRGPREHRGNDPALQGLVDRRRDVARMSGAGAPAVGLGEQHVAVRRLPGSGLPGRIGLARAKLPGEVGHRPGKARQVVELARAESVARPPPRGRPGSASRPRPCPRTSTPRSSGARSPRPAAPPGPAAGGARTTFLASPGLLFSMLRTAEIAFWMMEACPHTKARLLEAASHMNTSEVIDSR